jgi:protein involved in polysaccharide export with SLBB domain
LLLCRAVLCACLLALVLAACAEGPKRDDVAAQAHPDGRVAFDLIKIDDGVLRTLLDRKARPLREQLGKYVPPPKLAIAIGDTIGVVIWEAADNGLFGNSLTELTFPAGAAAQLQAGPPPALRGVPGATPGSGADAGSLAMLYGGAAAAALARPSEANAAEGALAASSRLQQFLDTATQSGRAGTRIPDQQVGVDGAISIPYGGRLRVAGRTPEEVERAIEQRLGPKALDPQALVVVERSAANTVSVDGEVVGGKRVPLSPGGDRLLQVIAAAGGAQAPVHDTFVQLSRGNTTATLPLAELVADPAEDIYARPGDVLTLVKRPQTLSVFGATGKNAAITFTSDRMTLAEALAKAGGLDDNRADPRAVFLFRYEPVAVVRALQQPLATGAPSGLSPVVYRLDLHKAHSYFLARRFLVQDKDVIFVADAKIQPIYHAFQALSLVTGPIESGFLICQEAKTC